MSDGLVGLSEVAGLAGVSRQAVTNWRIRYEDFPKPIQVLQSGPVWQKETIEAWVKKYRGEETHVISFINLKGGVAKTTTAVAVGEILAAEERKHVLIIDLDPQTNATVSLIPEELWGELDRDGKTIAQLFADRINPHEEPRFDVEKAIVRGVSTINNGIPRLDLLASSIRLVDLQDRIPMIALTGNFRASPIEILRAALKTVIDRYDYVIIDCPPSLGTVTKNGLRISTAYVIPTIPDILSTWGIYQIVDNINRFAIDMDQLIPALGIVATKVQRTKLHTRVMDDLANGRLGHFSDQDALPQPPLFKNHVPLRASVAQGAEIEADLHTFRGKYGPDAYSALRGIVQEIMDKCVTERS